MRWFYEDDNTLAPGTEKVKTTPYTGSKWKTYRSVYDANGNLISSIFEASSDYKSRNKWILRGPAVQPGSTTRRIRPHPALPPLRQNRRRQRQNPPRRRRSLKHPPPLWCRRNPKAQNNRKNRDGWPSPVFCENPQRFADLLSSSLSAGHFKVSGNAVPARAAGGILLIVPLRGLFQGLELTSCPWPKSNSA